MKNCVKYRPMMVLLPFLAACSGGDGGGATAIAAAPELDTAVTTQGIAQPAKGVKALSDFDLWTARLMADAISPVIATASDLTQTWVGANGKLSNVVVRVPRTEGKPTVTVTPPAAGADATPVMQTALAQLRKAGGGILKVAAGEYRFKTQVGQGQFLLSKLTDVDVQGSGAHFVFEADADGVYIEDSQRVRVRGIKMEDADVLSGYGRMRKVDGVMRLELNKPLPAGGSINWVQPVSESGRSWPQTQARAIFTPSTAQPTRIDDRTFTSSGFKPLSDGQYVSVKFTWYGRRAVYIRDSSRGVNEDIILDGVHIGSIGGIGVLVKTRGRGIAIQNSSISADVADRPYSTDYDGIHVISAAGDVLIRGNSISHTGDDQINLRSVIHKVSQVKPDSVTLLNDGRMVRVGDEVAFFTAGGEYTGRRIIKTAPPIGNSDTITFGLAPGEPINEAVYARDVNTTLRRFAVVNNTMSDSGGRGMLIQVPNGLIQGNVIRGLPRTAMRLLTSYDPWLEGAGAINVRISGNSIDSGGAELGFNYSTGIIMAMGEVTSAKIADNMQNGPIKIDNNKFVAPRAACIAIYNTKGITQENNSCGGA